MGVGTGLVISVALGYKHLFSGNIADVFDSPESFARWVSGRVRCCLFCALRGKAERFLAQSDNWWTERR